MSPNAREIIAMRLAPATLLILAMGGAAYLTWKLKGQHEGPGRDSARPISEGLPADRKSVGGPVKVEPNRGAEVLDGFRGSVHPLLHGATRLRVKAHWTPIGKGRDRLDRVVHPLVYSWFTQLGPARSQEIYTEQDFSAFLPETVGDVGQLWALDLARIKKFLKQFHPRASLELVSPGRRAGPNGAFAILRAVSPSYLDIVFRIHAEFYLTPEDWDPLAPIDAWYSPAYFSGSVLVNKRSGTVDYFRPSARLTRANPCVRVGCSGLVWSSRFIRLRLAPCVAGHVQGHGGAQRSHHHSE